MFLVLLSTSILFILFFICGLNPIDVYETALNNVKMQPNILIPLTLVAVVASAIGVMLGYLFTRNFRNKVKC
jgi:nitrate reductase gamma subunit